jgi:hypothetical protein
VPVAKILQVEGQYSEARLDKVSNAIQEALVGYRHGGCDLHAPAVGGRSLAYLYPVDLMKASARKSGKSTDAMIAATTNPTGRK